MARRCPTAPPRVTKLGDEFNNKCRISQLQFKNYMAPILLRTNEMLATNLQNWIIALFFALFGRISAAAPIDAPQPSNELFPLSEAPVVGLSAPRTEAPKLESIERWQKLRSIILRDFASRISNEFHVGEGLRERTEFWFDVYTRYGEAHHLIHHALYPWIVYRVVDATATLQDGKGPPWLRQKQAEKMAQLQAREIRRALWRLSKRNEFSGLEGLEKDLYHQLAQLPGPRKKIFQVAARQVRSQLGQKDFFQAGLVNSSRYLPYMEDEFARLNLPIELTRMPFVESSFNENARSKVGASGIWQIMPRTGRAYMIVNNTIDERNSPLKATVIAGRLLHSYNHQLRSWPLTITSYNNGIGNIQKAVRKVGSNDLTEIIARYHRGEFRFASSNFYTCFLAALYAEKYHELIFKEVPREPPQDHEILRLAGRTSVRHLEKITGLLAKDLLRYNLDIKAALRAGGALPRGFQLHLPPGYKDRLMRQTSTKDYSSQPSA